MSAASRSLTLSRGAAARTVNHQFDGSAKDWIAMTDQPPTRAPHTNKRIVVALVIVAVLVTVEQTAEADPGRYPGFPNFNVLAGGTGSLALAFGPPGVRPLSAEPNRERRQGGRHDDGQKAGRYPLRGQNCAWQNACERKADPSHHTSCLDAYHAGQDAFP
jgi:hypothetical protein